MQTFQLELIQIFHWRTLIPKDRSLCWVWCGPGDRDGYGIFSVRGHPYRSHRFSFEFHKRQILGHYLCCHTCDNPTCVNPDHLYKGTPASNMKDRKDRNRCNAPKGVNHWTVIKPGLVKKGTDLPQAKFTESVVRKIKNLILSGLTNKAISKIVNRDPSLISRIRHNRIWSHVIEHLPTQRRLPILCGRARHAATVEAGRRDATDPQYADRSE